MNSCIFCINSDGVDYKLIAKHEAHKRIIWACSWAPFKHEFATGSRDKTVKFWSVNRDSSSVKLYSTLPQFLDSVTALSWVGCDQSKCTGLLAVGMDNGLIEVWNVTSGRSEVPAFSASCAIRFDPFLCHVSTVYRLRWREVDGSDSAVVHQLASCGADHSVRVFDVHVK
jgi:elongator complex protein 2